MCYYIISYVIIIYINKYDIIHLPTQLFHQTTYMYLTPHPEKCRICFVKSISVYIYYRFTLLFNTTNASSSLSVLGQSAEFSAQNGWTAFAPNIRICAFAP